MVDLPEGRKMIVSGKKTRILHRERSGGADDYVLFTSQDELLTTAVD